MCFLVNVVSERIYIASHNIIIFIKRSEAFVNKLKTYFINSADNVILRDFLSKLILC